MPTHALLSALYIYPVKSLRGLAREAADVEPWGLAGDRRWMLVDADGRVITQRQQASTALVTAQPSGGGSLRFTAPGQEALEVAPPEQGTPEPVLIFHDKVDAVAAGDAADTWFSDYLGVPARLVHMTDPAVCRPVHPEFSRPGDTVSFADGFPLLLTATASLDTLNAHIARGAHASEGPLPMNRFRPNAVVDGTEGWAEDDWRRIRIGEVTFRVAKRCARCVVPTTNQETAERGREPMRSLAKHHRIDGATIFGQNLIPEHPGTLRVGDPLTILE
ncbi:MOSC domain-containing protein [Streptomyces sp. SID13666]|uniref:MOSC domain-containing protein n=1 Tax=Streptomyces TaxID=1883 RepID=UPI0011071AF4|nr:MULTISPECIES: MOSC N-terminal beta barrel domain-containing protein [Streptomyces]MCZ4101460.1 MOSC domain-containing protein [Streptomyces sp. H39-C1]NEA56089.1 MOSC domain-containing protein [Streptomyces sp. SID13666]NEA77167.1 MOSC domain-containing protein [Streptomyces sp. SID13588]QNA72145.1 MOSC domain-containing protein [Streptomyces sp. So13.3]